MYSRYFLSFPSLIIVQFPLVFPPQVVECHLVIFPVNWYNGVTLILTCIVRNGEQR